MEKPEKPEKPDLQDHEAPTEHKGHQGLSVQLDCLVLTEQQVSKYNQKVLKGLSQVRSIQISNSGRACKINLSKIDKSFYFSMLKMRTRYMESRFNCV